MGSWPALADDLEPGSLEAACRESLAYLEAADPARSVAFGSESFTMAEMAVTVRRGCSILTTETDPERRRQLLASEFRLMRSVGRDGHGEVLFTGYFEPLLEARRTPEEPFIHPVYGLPPDHLEVDWQAFGLDNPGHRLVGRVEGRKVIPYPDRTAIDGEGALPADTPVLGWVADPVELFFLHVQGSGTLVFDDGERLRAGYADTNGRDYVSIGRILIAEGAIPAEEMSMQAITAWLEAHPEERERILGANPSYVFFRPLEADGGPLGCYGRPLTAGRSIATDRGLFPAPILGWVRGTLPAAQAGDPPVAFARFVLNQDTGGSIRGPGRVDLFWGTGDAAGDRAGRTANRGEPYFLLPR
jgi:membrane-bound lytic murein transglycosylase A